MAQLIKDNWIYALFLTALYIAATAYWEHSKSYAISVEAVPSNFYCIHDDLQNIYTCFEED